jgi:predicted RNA binding protein YcfA (HicA-like mRNA interferase family)
VSKRKLPILKPAEVVTKLVALGFEEVRQKGSHKQFRHADGRCTTVPFHKGRDISLILHWPTLDEDLSFAGILEGRYGHR